MADSKNVTYAKPKIEGAISVAKIGASLPMDAVSELTGFKTLGYSAEDGLTNENTPETENIKAWGGDTVLVVQNSKEDKFTFKLIEILNIDVLKLVYGDDNVSGDLKTGITIKANSKPLSDVSMVIDMILKDDVLKRIVIPYASISEVGEISYVDNDAVGYELTVIAKPDNKGNCHYEYIKSTKDTGLGA